MGGIVGGGGGGGGGGSPAAPKYGASVPGANYTNPRDSVGPPYQSSYTPQTATPFLQSIMAQHNPQAAQQANSLGLPSLQSMFGMPQNSSPLQSGIQQLAPYIGSTYRPNMDAVRQNLTKVAPSVELQQKLDAEAKAKWDAEHPIGDEGLGQPRDTYNSSGGG